MILLFIFMQLHHCFRRRSCYPGHKYWVRAVAPCLAFALVGLACFAFLETEENYFYVHSAWHGCIALAILFILPKERHADADADPSASAVLHGVARQLRVSGNVALSGSPSMSSTSSIVVFIRRRLPAHPARLAVRDGQKSF